MFNIFGARRVFNSPLDETSIIGFAMGFSNNGFIPIPEIQFLAYFHNAEDQLRLLNGDYPDKELAVGRVIKIVD